MKLKRQKHVRKVLSFYKTNYGFEPPYRVLLDGTFCKAALKFKVNIAEQLPKYLDAEIEFLTTQCVLAECEAFGTLLYGPLKVLKQFRCIKCNHDPVLPAAVCVKRQANKKQKKYVVATQDSDLSERIRKLTGVPLVFISHNAIRLENPSEASRSKADSELGERLGTSHSEMDRLAALKKATFGEEEQPKRRKRKGPKGPNPLSCKKKKKTTHSSSSGSAVKAPTEISGTMKKKKRKRKKTKQTVSL